MTLQELAQFADVCAAAAIVVSLAFVGYEVRMNRRQSELTNWQALIVSLTDYKGLTNDREFAAFVTRAHESYEALSPADRLSFGQYMEQGVHIYTNFFKHNDALPQRIDGLDEAIGNCLREMLTTPGGRVWWTENQVRKRFRQGTYAQVNRLLPRY